MEPYTKFLCKIYCKKCREKGELLAEIKLVGDNLHIDFLVRHPAGWGLHFVGRKILRTVTIRE